MPIVALLLGMGAPSVQAAPSAEMCRSLPKSEPWKNHPTHIWNVVWRNKVALCALQAKLNRLQSAKVQSPQADQSAAPAPAMPIAPDNNQSLPKNP